MGCLGEEVAGDADRVSAFATPADTVTLLYDIFTEMSTLFFNARPLSVFYIPHAKNSWHMCQTSWGFENGEFINFA